MRSNGELYPHRDNRDGTFDSICPICFKTVARKRNEAELADAERDHVCDAEDLRRLKTHTEEPSEPIISVEQQGEDSPA